MSTNKTTTSARGRDLVLTRIINAPREQVFNAWTDPELLTRWFAPKPWTTPKVEMNARIGGAALFVMMSPERKEFLNRWVCLEAVKNERLVFTDAFSKAWEPSDKPFMTVDLTFEDQDGNTKYTAIVRHWTDGDREAHEKMGFHGGWAMCTEQLAALVGGQ